MITDSTFESRFTFLLQLFNRTEMPESVVVFYYEFLNDKLDDEQFISACQHIAEEERFFPAPATFIEKAGQNSAARAEADWARIIQAIRHGDCRLQTPISPAGTSALASLGGVQVIGMDEESKLPWYRQRFLDSYKNLALCGLSTLAPAAPAPQIEPAEEAPTPKMQPLPPELRAKFQAAIAEADKTNPMSAVLRRMNARFGH